MKHKYEEMNATLQNIKCYWKCRQPSKNKIAKQLIMNGEYKPDPNIK